MNIAMVKPNLQLGTDGSTITPPEYKRTEVGVIPEGWEICTLGKMGQFKNGINKGKQDFGHGFPFVNLMDVFGFPKVSKMAKLGLVNSSVEEQQAYGLQSGDVIFVRSSVKPEGVGLTTLIIEDLPNTVFSGFLIRYRSHDKLAFEFKEHCFWESGFRNRLVASSTVSANTNINQEALKPLKIAFPSSKYEQRAIAEALSDVDKLIEALEKLIAKKRAIKKAAMQQLLTGKTRLPGFSGEWRSCTLGDLGTFSKGRGIKRDDVSDDGVACIRYGELYTRYYDYIITPVSRISFLVASTALQIKTGDLLFAGSGETAEEIGRCAAYIGEEEVYAGGDIIVLTLTGQNSLYLGHLMNYETVAAQKARLGQGDAVVHINSRNMAQVKIELPPIAEQNAIATVLSDMDVELAALERRREKTKQIKQGMMQELLTGRIRLVKPEAAA